MNIEDAFDITKGLRPMSRGPILADKDSLYDSEEQAKKALRRGKWNENANGWSRKISRGSSHIIEIAKIVRFDGLWKISVEAISREDFLSWS